jgi:hypothetical protein
MDTSSAAEVLLWLGGASAILAVAISSVGTVLLRGPKTSDVPIWGGILRAVALLLGVGAVGLIGAWLILR